MPVSYWRIRNVHTLYSWNVFSLSICCAFGASSFCTNWNTVCRNWNIHKHLYQAICQGLISSIEDYSFQVELGYKFIEVLIRFCCKLKIDIDIIIVLMYQYRIPVNHRFLTQILNILLRDHKSIHLSDCNWPKDTRLSRK